MHARYAVKFWGFSSRIFWSTVSKVLDRSIKTPIALKRFVNFGQKVAIMHDQLNGPFGNRIVLDKVFLSYLTSCFKLLKYLYNRLYINCLRILEKHGSTDIGY